MIDNDRDGIIGSDDLAAIYNSIGNVRPLSLSLSLFVCLFFCLLTFVASALRNSWSVLSKAVETATYLEFRKDCHSSSFFEIQMLLLYYEYAFINFSLNYFRTSPYTLVARGRVRGGYTKIGLG